MSNSAATRLWLMRLAFVVLCLMVIFVQLMPLETVPRSWTGPDLLLVLSAVWVLRRPDYAPAVLIAGLMLLADCLYMRPPGLFAGVAVIVCENLTRRSLNMRDVAFPMEWLTAAGAMAAIVVGNRVLTSIFILDQVPLGLTVIQLIMSILAYPLVVAFSFAFLGLRRASPRDLDNMAGRP